MIHLSSPFRGTGGFVFLTYERTQNRIKQLAKKYCSEFIEVRHHFHANPELSYQEFETSKFIQKKLQEFEYSI